MYRVAVAARRDALQAYADFVKRRPGELGERDKLEEQTLVAQVTRTIARVQDLERRAPAGFLW